MLEIKSKVLTGRWIQLEPLHETHKNELYDAAQDEKIWTFNGSKAYGEKFHRWFDKAINCFANQQHLPFVVRRLADNKILGSTRFYDINAEHHRATIGYTWYIPEVWRSYVNPESKFLLLQFAFEDLSVNRIEFCTDIRNTHSAGAIKKLGAVQEGILRQHMILEDGFVRDSIVFSIIQSDWPQLKSKLQGRLNLFSNHTEKFESHC